MCFNKEQAAKGWPTQSTYSIQTPWRLPPGSPYDPATGAADSQLTYRADPAPIPGKMYGAYMDSEGHLMSAVLAIERLQWKWTSPVMQGVLAEFVKQSPYWASAICVNKFSSLNADLFESLTAHTDGCTPIDAKYNTVPATLDDIGLAGTDTGSSLLNFCDAFTTQLCASAAHAPPTNVQACGCFDNFPVTQSDGSIGSFWASNMRSAGVPRDCAVASCYNNTNAYQRSCDEHKATGATCPSICANFLTEDVKSAFNDSHVSQTLVCGKDGFTIKDNPKCGTSNVAPTNGTPGNCPENLYMNHSCQPVCNDGYTASGPTQCVDSDGKGTPKLIAATCDAEPCAITEKSLPADGTTGNCPASLGSGSSCTPGCSAGFKPGGKLTCAAGKLSSTATCAPITCDNVQAPKNGTTGNCPTSLKEGTSCKPTCDEGYTYSGDTSCSTTGVLTATTCAAKPCDASKLVAGAKDLGTGATRCSGTLASGSTCKLNCKDGYKLTKDASCTAGTLTPAVCSDQVCDATSVSLPRNAKDHGICTAKQPHGSQCTIACKDDYAMSGTVSCGSDGKLTSTAACTYKYCDATKIALPANAKSHGGCSAKQLRGSTCKIECEDGYDLSGNVSCDAEGNVTSTSKCNPKQCAITAPQNGAMGNCPTTLSSGESCTPTCGGIYSLVGGKSSCDKGKLKPASCSNTPFIVGMAVVALILIAAVAVAVWRKSTKHVSQTPGDSTASDLGPNGGIASDLGSAASDLSTGLK